MYSRTEVFLPLKKNFVFLTTKKKKRLTCTPLNLNLEDKIILTTGAVYSIKEVSKR